MHRSVSQVTDQDPLDAEGSTEGLRMAGCAARPMVASSAPWPTSRACYAGRSSGASHREAFTCHLATACRRGGRFTGEVRRAQPVGSETGTRMDQADSISGKEMPT